MLCQHTRNAPHRRRGAPVLTQRLEAFRPLHEKPSGGPSMLVAIANYRLKKTAPKGGSVAINECE
jgi:hypothetical protein